MSLKFGNDLNVVKNIDERLQRLLVMFDFKPEEDNSGIEDLSLERQEPINVCPEEFKGQRIVHLNHYFNLQICLSRTWVYFITSYFCHTSVFYYIISTRHTVIMSKAKQSYNVY